MIAFVAESVAKAQKFAAGDRVEVTSLPVSMSHFSKGKATVLYSYAQAYDATEEETDRLANEYALQFDDHGYSAWYPASVLRRIEIPDNDGGVPYVY